MRPHAFALAILGLATVASAQDLAPAQPPDQQRSAWKWRRPVQTAPADATTPFASLPLPPELTAHAGNDLHDLRLLDATGRDVPYVLDRQEDRQAVTRFTGILVDTGQEKKVRSWWMVDLGEPRAFDRLEMEIPEQDFAKVVRVEGSVDGATWQDLEPRAGIFEREWQGGRVRQTAITLAQPAHAKVLRLAVDDHTSAPITITAVAAVRWRGLPGERWERAAALVSEAAPSEGVSRFRVEAPAGLAYGRLHLRASETAFARDVTVRELTERNGSTDETVLGEGRLYRLAAGEPLLAGESVEIEVRAPSGGRVVIDVQDGDSPPLRSPGALVSGAARRILFAASAQPAWLYYGNSATRAALYDVESLRVGITLSPRFADASLGSEARNPRYAPVPPLAWAGERGPQIPVGRWRASRAVNVGAGQDIYTLTLSAADVALLRPDAGDLRIVDGEGHQVPYVLEPAAAEDNVNCAMAKVLGVAGGAGPQRSRYRIQPEAAAVARAALLPMRAVELTFGAQFFSRPARLLEPAVVGRQGERVLWTGVLQRRPDQAAANAGVPTVVIPLDGERHGELALEIEEGNNSPLPVSRAIVRVPVPRVAFPAATGTYRLLVGNAEATAPQYDIAILRQEVLSRSAVPVDAGATDANPSYRRQAGDYLRDAPPTVLLWVALIGAVLALVGLTLRVLKQPPAP